jgi:hypothetical protein
MRATWSTEPPGGNTATNLIGCLVGQACAQDNSGKQDTKAAQAARDTQDFMAAVPFVKKTHSIACSGPRGL